MKEERKIMVWKNKESVLVRIQHGEFWKIGDLVHVWKKKIWTEAVEMKKWIFGLCYWGNFGFQRGGF